MSLASPRRGVAAGAFLAVALHGAAARADGGSGESVVFALSGLFWASGAGLGLVTDAGVGAHMLSSDGRVPRSWAVTGTVAWGVATAAASVFVFETHVVANEPQYGSGGTDAAAFAIVYGALGVSAASLAVSIYALTRPPERQLRARRSSPSLSLPLIAPSPSGGSVFMVGAF